MRVPDLRVPDLQGPGLRVSGRKADQVADVPGRCAFGAKQRQRTGIVTFCQPLARRIPNKCVVAIAWRRKVKQPLKHDMDRGGLGQIFTAKVPPEV